MNGSPPSFASASAPAPDLNAPRIGAGTLSGFAALGAGVLATAITTPIVLHALGARRFGLWVALVAAVSFTGLLDFGISQAIARFIGEHRARRDAQAVQAFILATGAAYLVAFALVLLATLAIGFAFPWFITVPAAERGLILPGTVLVGVATAFGLWSGFFASILHAHQRLPLANAVRAGGWIAFIILTIVAALSGWGMIGLAAAMAGSGGLTCLAFVIMFRRLFPELRLRRPEGRYLRQGLRYSLLMFLVSTGAAVVFETDTLVIAVLVGAEAVTAYAVTLRLTRGLTGFLHRVSDVLFPFYAGMRASGERPRLRENFLTTARIELAGAVMVSLGLCFAGRPLLAAWVGAANVSSLPVFTLAIVLLLSESLVHPAAVLAAATGGERSMAVVNNTEAVLNLALSIALALRFGVVGVIGATVLAQGATNLWFLPAWAMRSLGISARAYLSATFLRVVAPAAGAGLIGLLITHLWSSAAGGLVAAVAAAGVFAGIYLTTGGGALERGWARSVMLRGERAA